MCGMLCATLLSIGNRFVCELTRDRVYSRQKAGQGHAQVTINCEDVWRELANYLEGDLPEWLRATMQDHFRECHHCSVVLDGVRNRIHMLGDDRSFDLPVGSVNVLSRGYLTEKSTEESRLILVENEGGGW